MKTIVKNKLKVLTLQGIRDLNPCYDPIQYLDKNWKGTALDILKVADCPAPDRLWVVLHVGIIPTNIMVLFACWTARQAIRVSSQTDERCLKAIKLAEKWAKDPSSVSIDELDAAIAAINAASDAASDAASNAAIAASYAARYAASAASNAARYAASDAASYAATRNKQIKRLIKMLEDWQNG